MKLGHSSPINARLAAPIDPCRLGLGYPFELPLAPEVGFEFREYAQHIEEALPGGGPGVNRLLRCLQGRATGLQGPYDVLQVTDVLRASRSILVTMRTSPARRKSSTVCSSARPSVVVPLRFSD